MEAHFSRVKPDGRREALVGKACAYLGKEFHEVLKVKAAAAAGVMEWLSAVARQMAKSGQHRGWVVPRGDAAGWTKHCGYLPQVT